MTLLFDTSPDEPTRTRKSRRPAAVAVAPEPVDPAGWTLPVVPTALLGRIDDHYECRRCEAKAHDILAEDGREWWVACAFCGLMSWEKAVAGHLKPKAKEFVFSDGRFAGKTLSEAAAEPRGLEYIRWAAENHKRPTVRQVCRNHLDGSGAAV
jgi:hypothetical protein